MHMKALDSPPKKEGVERRRRKKGKHEKGNKGGLSYFGFVIFT